VNDAGGYFVPKTKLGQRPPQHRNSKRRVGEGAQRRAHRSVSGSSDVPLSAAQDRRWSVFLYACARRSRQRSFDPLRRMNAWARRGACHRAALCADPLAPLLTLRLPALHDEQAFVKQRPRISRAFFNAHVIASWPRRIGVGLAGTELCCRKAALTRKLTSGCV
jgi:hypothetical protein